MRTSLNEIKLLESYVSRTLRQPDFLLVSARLIVDPVLKMNLSLQQKVYALVRLYGRKKLKSELDVLHQKLMDNPDKPFFRKKIEQIFPK